MSPKPRNKRTGFFCDLPKGTIKRIKQLSRQRRLAQWEVVDLGVKGIK